MPDATTTPTEDRDSLPHPLLTALAFGLAGGLAEVAGLALARTALARFTHTDPQNVWAAPAGLALIALVITLPLVALDRGASRPLVRRTAIGIGAFLAMLNALLQVRAVHWLARAILAAGVGARAGALARGRPGTAGRLVRRSLPVLVLVPAVLGIGVNAAEALRERRALAALPAPPAGATNVLLVVLDAVRAADLSLYGFKLPTTPHLEAFARRGVTFERAYSVGPWTLPSHASMFTGHHAHELAADWTRPFERGPRTLAEAFSERGYATAGIAGNLVYTTRESGLARGFTHYQDFRLEPATLLGGSALAREVAGSPPVRRTLSWYQNVRRVHASAITDGLLDWLDTERDGRPFFAFVNYYDAHDPYLPSAANAERFGVPTTGRRPQLENTRPVTAAEAGPERAAYDACIADLDAELGRLFDALAARGFLEHTVVIVVSDHGEQFGRRGLLTHGNSLYPASLHVPLVIVGPGLTPGQRVPGAVSLRDLAATIADLAQLEGEHFPGRSLRRSWEAGVAHDTALASVRWAPGQPDWFPIYQGDLYATLTDSLELIRGVDGIEELLDIFLDARAGRNVPADSAEAAASQLRPLLLRAMQRR